MNALLIYPRFPVTYWGYQYVLGFIGKEATLPPLGLITVAALLPKDWKVRLVDLNVSLLSNDDLRWADVVLTGGMLVQEESIREIISRVRALNIPVAVGGPAPTTSPALFSEANVVFRGEAEGRIDEMVSALLRESADSIVLDAPAEFPPMASVPVPRFDLLDLKKYASMSVQYSRGCPFQCEFCDIIEIFGRKTRVKSTEQVENDLEAIYRLGYTGVVFIVDDNFIGNKPAVRRLLPALQEWQRTHERPFAFFTEASVDLASDPKLMSGMADAGFTAVFLGIETPSTKALEQAKKLQNLRLDPSEAIDRITRAGIEVMGGFIVGFDSDSPGIFAAQRRFLDRLPVPLAMIGILTALPGTALWRRLKSEGRLRRASNGDPFSGPNFAPAMDERRLLTGYAKLIRHIYSPKEYYRRCETYLNRVRVIPDPQSSTLGDLGSLLRAVWHVGVLSPRRRNFWLLVVRAVRKGRRMLRQAVIHAVQGEHFIMYTREHVVPRLERALSRIGT